MTTKSIFGAALSLLLLASSASAYNRSGSNCQPGDGAAAVYAGQFTTPGGVGNAGFAAGYMVCPLDPQANLGTHIQWSFRVIDNHPSDFIQCTGVTYDANGVQVASALSNQSGAGTSTLSAVTAFQTAPTHSHTAYCKLPQISGLNQSQILRYELF